MAFPKTQLPVFEMELPSTGKTIRYRPMTVREEKVLLIAKTTETETDMMLAIKQVVANCVLEETFDVDSIPIFDLEFVFLRIKAVSSDNIIKLTFEDVEDHRERTFDIDLLTVMIHRDPEPVPDTIELEDGFVLKLRYPPASVYTNDAGDGEAFTDRVVRSCIEAVYEGDVVHRASDQTDEEIDEFVLGLSSQVYAKIDEFLMKMPRLHHVIEYTNDRGTPRKIVLSTLSHFFTLR